MKTILTSLLLMIALMLRPGLAQQAGQDIAWVQIEAHPSLSVAQARARLYAGSLEDVNGFALGGNWYGIVLGPYSREDAERALDFYKAERRIPQDSFIAFSSNFGQQYWPVGANALNSGTVAAPTTAQAPETTTVAEPVETGPTEPVVEEPAEPVVIASRETPAEARQSERLLTREERMELQVALQAAGFYESAIDGAFGRGTRSSMEAWQYANNYEPTGVLTTAQRKALMDEYNAPLISVGMRLVTDRQAGIQMQLPMDEVEFDRYEPPFAHYETSGSVGARVLLISQPGDQATLFGLYDIMQTLEIVPLNGPRDRGSSSFTLEGRNSKIHSYTQASLENGQIKGFTLIWPNGDEARRARVLAEMKASFTRTENVLDPGAGANSEQSIDLVSGLAVRKPKLSRSGFYVDSKGTIVTTAEAVEQCTRITIDHEYQAEVVATDDTLGVAVLRPVQALAPISVARLRDNAPQLQSDIAVSGYSYEGILGAPTLTFGTLADIKGLGGEENLQRLTLNALPGDAGGPVMDISGGVVGMLLPAKNAARQLPENVSLAANAASLHGILLRAGITTEPSNERGSLPAAEMNRLANGMTVLVSCWDS
ncbi:peptidoglycan-binding protein [Sulfitobacter sp. BDSS02]|nr:peptidoglycan-binding protein [Sulfitobacter sp. BDSS02]MBR9849112.1 peptidoglycan-binding protein [Paracoccaceae bacterium]